MKQEQIIWQISKAPKKATCTHRNGILIEVIYATHSRAVTNGVVCEEGVNNIEDISHYQYECKGCGGTWITGTLNSKISKIPVEFHFLENALTQ